MTDPIDAAAEAFRRQLAGAIILDEAVFRADSARFASLLLAGADPRAVSVAVYSFASSCTDPRYAAAVFADAATTWAQWVLWEGDVASVSTYSRRLEAFLVAVRLTGVRLYEEPDIPALD